MTSTIPNLAFGLVLTCSSSAYAQTTGSNAIPVTVDNFIRAESDLYLGHMVKEGSLGKFVHRREPAAIDNQMVIRLNRDTLYSAAVVDLNVGPVTIALPDAGRRFMSMQVISQDHYTPAVYYGKGSHLIDKRLVGTRYAVIAVRTFVDPENFKDVKQAHALQDAIKVDVKAVGKFEVPNWDQTRQKKVRDALLILASTIPDLRGAFGTKGKVDPIRHLLGTALGWGGNPDNDAMYLNVTPKQNDGKTIYRLKVRDVPVDGFWSVSLYNAEGYFEKNAYGAYTLNNVTAKPSEDSSIMIQFGGCDGKIANCLPITAGWNYTVRLYRPRAEILNGKWKFPEAEPVS